MALTDDGVVTTMPVAPAYAGNGGFGGFGGDSWGWVILLLLFAGGGWGNGFGGGFGGGYEFPWLFNGQQGINNNTNNGFRDAMLNDGITSVRDGLSALSTQLCGCCSDTQMAIANLGANIEQGANARQMANMQTAFDLQNAVSTGFNNVGLQLCQASGENRLATANIGADIAREACATRTSDTQNTQVILNAINDGFRLMSDQRYQDKIDSKNEKIADLQRQLSVSEQNSFIAQGLTNEVDALYNRLSNCPVPTTPVYGRTPIFTCNQNQVCGCGCGM